MDTIAKVVQEYLEVVDSIHGAYLDAITGFMSLVDEFDRAREEMLARRPDIPPEAFDGAAMVYGTGLPHRHESRIVHSCTQREYRQRNAEDGQNHKVMGQVSLVQMYGYWEDCYRGKLANLCRKPKGEIKLDIIGDIRLLRNSIIHHRGIALREIQKVKLLNWFNEGDLIYLKPEHFEVIVETLRIDLRGCAAKLARQAC